jgi:hypothetical protein
MTKDRTYEQKRKITKILKKTGEFLAVCFLLLIISGIVQGAIYATTTNYAFDIILNRLSRGISSNDLDLMALYAQETLDMIADKSGNPAWLFPVERTDWDVLKLDLKNMINTIEAASAECAVGTDAYEEATRMGRLSLTAIDIRIEKIRYAAVFNNKEVAGGIAGYMIGVVAIPIVVGILWGFSPRSWY